MRHVHGRHGRRPRGTGGRSPQELRWGTAHASVPPTILRSSVCRMVWKHEQSKKRCHQGIIFWNRGFSREERIMYDITRQRHEKSWERYGRENGNCFLKKRHLEISVFDIFPVPKLGARSPPMMGGDLERSCSPKFLVGGTAPAYVPPNIIS